MIPYLLYLSRQEQFRTWLYLICLFFLDKFTHSVLRLIPIELKPIFLDRKFDADDWNISRCLDVGSDEMQFNAYFIILSSTLFSLWRDVLVKLSVFMLYHKYNEAQVQWKPCSHQHQRHIGADNMQNTDITHKLHVKHSEKKDWKKEGVYAKIHN